MPIKQKKIFVAFSPVPNDQSLFYRLWRFMHNDQLSVQQEADFEPALRAVAADIDRWQDQMRRQQVHIDEIKRLCHVPC